MLFLEKVIKYIMYVIVNCIEYVRYVDSLVGRVNDYRFGETSWNFGLVYYNFNLIKI